MSTLVIVRKGNKAVIGSDSQFSQGDNKVSAVHKANHHKIYKVKDAYIGFTGWSALQNIFENVIEKYSKKLDFRSRSRIFKPFFFFTKS